MSSSNPFVWTARLDGLVRSARAAWPGVEISPDAFARHLARHTPADLPIERALEGMHTDDLYLACACALGDSNALLAFEQHCLQTVAAAISGFRASSDLIDEVKQRVRDRTLVSADGAPKIASFSGRGDLRSWVRVMAVREAIDLMRRSNREAPLEDDSLLHALVTPGDPALEHVKTRYREEFQQAFSAALRGLSARDQTLLRQTVIDGITIDRLAALHHVHRATAARWVDNARRALRTATRERLAARLRVTGSELDSILRLIRSRLDVTLRWLVRRRRRG